jgi:SAM domain (Sterile alpha motif)
MDMTAWLRDLKLECYISAFRDNDIDADVLLKLTAEDLIMQRGSLGRPPAQAARRDCEPPYGHSDRRGGGGAGAWCIRTSRR